MATQTKVTSLIRLFKTISAAFFLATATAVSAAPPAYSKSHLSVKKHISASTVAEIQASKKGDRYALVCIECKTIDIKKVTEEKRGEALCHDSGFLHFDSCQRQVKIKRAAGDIGAISIKVSYLN